MDQSKYIEMTESAIDAAPEIWSYRADESKDHRVRAFEPYPGAPLRLEWGKSPQQKEKCLSMVTGAYPVRNRAVARELADRVAKQLGGDAEPHNSFRFLAALPLTPTLAKLYDSYLENLAQGVGNGSTHAQEQRYRDFWCGTLGPEERICDITFEEAIEAARRASSRRGWSDRACQSHITSILQAFRFGHEEGRIHRLQLMSSVDLAEPAETIPTPRWLQAFRRSR